MTNDLIRGDVNWFDGRRSQRRSAKVSGRRKTVATAQDERRRLITLGLDDDVRQSRGATQPAVQLPPEDRGLRLRSESCIA